MSNSKRLPLAHVDYKPAKFYKPKSKNWIVRFHYKIPGTNKFKAFRRRVKPLSNEKERLKLGKHIEQAINEQLQSGWSPFKESQSFDFVVDLLADFELYTKRKYDSGEFRYDTKRSYISNLSKFKRFLKAKDLNRLTTNYFDRSLITKYIDWLEFDVKNSATTINNNVTVLKVICNYFIDRGLIQSNPVDRIKRKRQSAKKRTVIPEPVLKDIFEHQKTNHYNFYVLMLMCYFCFLRTTELTKLKVKHIDIDKQLIFVPANISKNRKDDFITIPDLFAEVLNEHISKAKKQDYVFSFHDFTTGKKKASSKRITKRWVKMREKLSISTQYDFYSLKDTGITKLLEKGVPLIKVRDQARHHDIKITEKYTPRRTVADDTIRNTYSNFDI